uniref:Uncharacterized protein n=1 Tax=Nelumbo nucifera TaxID=4432 RepID=A0A822Z4R7_NELNU|nr:TPA_asm: hypothetical protein HUJ06_014140 [Nelumbo nucifera]
MVRRDCPPEKTQRVTKAVGIMASNPFQFLWAYDGLKVKPYLGPQVELM